MPASIRFSRPAKVLFAATLLSVFSVPVLAHDDDEAATKDSTVELFPPRATINTTALDDSIGLVQLFKPKGDDFEKVALARVKGVVRMRKDDVVSGQQAFLSLQFPDRPDQWIAVSKRELINGRLIVTLANGKVYTIYELQENFAGKIAAGRVTRRVKHAPRRFVEHEDD